MPENNSAKILAVVKAIPRGKVATYGLVARLAGLPRNARQVGAALGNLACESTLPWHRVVNSKGHISSRGGTAGEQLQRSMLESEGVEFSETDAIDLSRFLWSRSGEFR